MITLALLAVLAAGLNWPGSLGGAPVLTKFLQSALPAPPIHHGAEAWLEIVNVCASLLGIPVAWMVTGGARNFIRRPVSGAPVTALHRFWFAGWGFDWLYDRLFVWPFVWIARINKNDSIDLLYRGIADLTKVFHHLLKLTQAGHLRWYATGLVLGAIIIVTLVLSL